MCSSRCTSEEAANDCTVVQGSGQEAAEDLVGEHVLKCSCDMLR